MEALLFLFFLFIGKDKISPLPFGTAMARLRGLFSFPPFFFWEVWEGLGRLSFSSLGASGRGRLYFLFPFFSPPATAIKNYRAWRSFPPPHIKDARVTAGSLVFLFFFWDGGAWLFFFPFFSFRPADARALFLVFFFLVAQGTPPLPPLPLLRAGPRGKHPCFLFGGGRARFSLFFFLLRVPQRGGSKPSFSFSSPPRTKGIFFLEKNPLFYRMGTSRFFFFFPGEGRINGERGPFPFFFLFSLLPDRFFFPFLGGGGEGQGEAP